MILVFLMLLDHCNNLLLSIHLSLTRLHTPGINLHVFSFLPPHLTVLGLATEDGGIIYYAKSVERIASKKEDLDLPIGKNKVFSMLELRLKIEKEYGNTPWGKGMFDDLFRWL